MKGSGTGICLTCTAVCRMLQDEDTSDYPGLTTICCADWRGVEGQLVMDFGGEERNGRGHRGGNVVRRRELDGIRMRHERWLARQDGELKAGSAKQACIDRWDLLRVMDAVEEWVDGPTSISGPAVIGILRAKRALRAILDPSQNRTLDAPDGEV